jgi:hypothetical protein
LTLVLSAQHFDQQADGDGPTTKLSGGGLLGGRLGPEANRETDSYLKLVIRNTCPVSMVKIPRKYESSADIHKAVYTAFGDEDELDDMAIVQRKVQFDFLKEIA